MTGEAVAEAWIRKRKRIIQNQSLIQLLVIIAAIIPLPFVGLVFWLIFALSPIVIQSIIALWAVSTIIYITLTTYARIKQRRPL